MSDRDVYCMEAFIKGMSTWWSVGGGEGAWCMVHGAWIHTWWIVSSLQSLHLITNLYRVS